MTSQNSPNPYAKYLNGRDAREVIKETAAEIAAAAVRIGPERCEQPIAPGKWSPRQIVAHLADCEIAFSFRLRQTLAEEHHVVQPFDQDAWSAHYGAYSMDSALAVFEALRRFNIELIGALPAEALTRPVSHPERGMMTFMTLVETMAGHDTNHLLQLRAL